MKADKHKAFADEYVRNGYHATDAYRHAYPNASYVTCMKNGSKLANQADIKEYINQQIEANRKSFEVTREEIIIELKELIADSKKDKKKDRVTILKCLDILNKMSSNYIQRVEAKIDGTIKLSFGNSNDLPIDEDIDDEDNDV